MSTSAEPKLKAKFQRGYVPTTALAKSVEFSGGILHWDEIDQDLSIANLLAGADNLSA